MEAIKTHFIRKYILPIFDPLMKWGEKYGIDRVTVIGIPVLALLIAALIKAKGENIYSILIIINMCLIIYAIIVYQFFR
jgi:coenzyme F420-reducing hydrogenase beta subunit